MRFTRSSGRKVVASADASAGARRQQSPKRSSTRALAAMAESPVAHRQGPIIMDSQILHSIEPHRLDLLKGMGTYMETKVYPLLKPTSKCWQPADLLPDSTSDTFIDEVMALREDAKELSDDYLVVLTGDMITEEALPTYMSMINTLDGVRDETGASNTPWARWTREWTAEENRHGDLINKYLYLTGRVNMRAVEVTVQNLIGSGMNPKTENNPYLGFIYTSFQERATKISHGNTARQAMERGGRQLQRMCALIGGDEARHEQAYQKIVEELFRLDPDGTMLAFEDMMRKQIVMPAHLMDDNEHASKNSGRNLFNDFAAVADRLGVYTAFDYADIVEYLLRHWKISDIVVKQGDAVAAQEYLMKLPQRIRRLAERTEARKAKAAKENNDEIKFSWVYDRPVPI